MAPLLLASALTADVCGQLRPTLATMMCSATSLLPYVLHYTTTNTTTTTGGVGGGGGGGSFRQKFTNDVAKGYSYLQQRREINCDRGHARDHAHARGRGRSRVRGQSKKRKGNYGTIGESGGSGGGDGSDRIDGSKCQRNASGKKGGSTNTMTSVPLPLNCTVVAPDMPEEELLDILYACVQKNQILKQQEQQQQQQQQQQANYTDHHDRHISVNTDRHHHNNNNNNNLLSPPSSYHRVVFQPGSRYGACEQAYARMRNLLGRRDSIASWAEQQAYYRLVERVFSPLHLPVQHSKGRIELARLPDPVIAIPSSWLPGRTVGMREHYGLVSAASWHSRGVLYDELEGLKLVPEPGTYFATPNSDWVSAHFGLLRDWIESGGVQSVSHAVDVGTGIGIIALMLARANPLAHVTAIDINPNAVKSTQANAARHSIALGGHTNRRIQAVCGSLLEPLLQHKKQETDFEQLAAPDLVVFNPPWIPEEEDTATIDLADGVGVISGPFPPTPQTPPSSSKHLVPDTAAVERSLSASSWIRFASYRPANLLSRFFEQAHALLPPKGRVLILYSNYARLVGAETEHPIEVEIDAHPTRWSLQTRRCELVSPPPPGRTSTMRRPWQKELLNRIETELWVLERKQ